MGKLLELIDNFISNRVEKSFPLISNNQYQHFDSINMNHGTDMPDMTSVDENSYKSTATESSENFVDCLGCRITGSLTFCLIGASASYFFTKKAQGKANIHKYLLIINGVSIAALSATLAAMRMLNIGIFATNKSYTELLKDDLNSLKQFFRASKAA